MKLTTVVYKDQINANSVIACVDGDAIDERDEAKLWECAVQSAEACMHIFKTPQALMSYIRMQHKALLLNHRDKKKEPIGS
jgi:hypothetical protein